MKGSALASRPHAVICSFCEAGELFFLGDDSACCTTCGGHLGGALLETLREIVALADTLGEHACDCGHPEMRRVPDGVFLCPIVALRSFLRKATLHTGHTPRLGENSMVYQPIENYGNLSVGGFLKDGVETHRALLEAGIWVIEGLDLSKVKPGEYELVCLPIKVQQSDGAPARAILRAI